MRAYILLEVLPQETISVYEELKADQFVTEAAVIHGPYDCVALLEGATLEEINDVVMRLRQKEGVRGTMTCLVVQSYHKRRG